MPVAREAISPLGTQDLSEIAGGFACMQVMCVCRAMRMPGRMQLLQRPAGEAKLPGSSSPSSPRERVAPGAASCRCTGGTAAESSTMQTEEFRYRAFLRRQFNTKLVRRQSTSRARMHAEHEVLNICRYQSELPIPVIYRGSCCKVKCASVWN